MEEKIKALRGQILAHAALYYDADSPTLSDYEYDMLLRSLAALEEQYPEFATEDSPTKRVGGTAGEKFSPVTHQYPLESLQDVFSIDELWDFLNKTAKTVAVEDYVLEAKIDGLSVSLEYDKGVFIRGATRGDGAVGEDVTENLKTIVDLPKTIPYEGPLVVRGEVYMPREVFLAINAQREASGEKLLANPRNAAAGSLRQLESDVAKSRRLSLFCFNIQNSDRLDLKKHSEALDFLKSLGFPVSPNYRVLKAEELEQGIADLNEGRAGLGFDIDGAVIKVNDFGARAVLGSTSKFPKWAAAYKYPPEVQETRIEDILITVGRTGVLTPSAALTPVHIGGSMVSRASLHNSDYIAAKDIRIGDYVHIRKAGEIIPEVIEVILSKRPVDTAAFAMPTVCPVCGAKAQRIGDDVALYCTGAECPAQLLRNIMHFASRNAMNIDGLGGAIVELLVKERRIASAADLYTLTADVVKNLERMGKKSAMNLIENIKKSKENDLSRLLFAFGIRQVGEKAAKVLSEHFGHIDAIMAASVEDLTAIADIGGITAQSVVDWCASPQAGHMIGKLKEAGVNMTGTQSRKGDLFLGKTFVVTGTLVRFTRDEIQAMIASWGGKASGSVSKKTSYVVAGEAAGSKLKKALDLGVPVLTEEEFINLLEEAKE